MVRGGAGDTGCLERPATWGGVGGIDNFYAGSRELVWSDLCFGKTTLALVLRMDRGRRKIKIKSKRQGRRGSKKINK